MAHLFKPSPVMRRFNYGSQMGRRRARRLQFFRPLVVEGLEQRHLLTSGMFFVQLDGLPDTSDDDRVAAAAARFHASGLTESQVKAIGVVDPRESILIRTPVDATLRGVVQQLLVVPGFVDVDAYDPGASADEPAEEEEQG